jgi:integrase
MDRGEPLVLLDVRNPKAWASSDEKLPTHLIESGYDIRTAHELLGHSDVNTAMIHARPDSQWRGVRRPADVL